MVSTRSLLKIHGPIGSQRPRIWEVRLSGEEAPAPLPLRSKDGQRKRLGRRHHVLFVLVVSFAGRGGGVGHVFCDCSVFRGGGGRKPILATVRLYSPCCLGARFVGGNDGSETRDSLPARTRADLLRSTGLDVLHVPHGIGACVSIGVLFGRFA